MLERLSLYFSYELVWFILIVGALISLCASLFGVILVLKRMSFIGDGLSHVAFGAMAIAAVVNLTNNIWIVMPITVLAAILLLIGGKRARLKGDAAIAVISVGALAFGYMLMKLFPSGNANIEGDVCSGLFGASSILYINKTDVILCAVLAAVVLTVFVLLYNRIFAVTFDEDFSRAIGLRASFYNLLLAVVTALIIVMAMKLVGSLLISALIVFPVLSAMRVFKSFRGVVICSAVLSVTCALIGILTAIALSTPVGPTIVCTDILAFLIFILIAKIKG